MMKTCSCFETISLTDSTGLEHLRYGICNGTKEKERCTCEGNYAKCDFSPENRAKALKEYKEREMKKYRLQIYYAHHQWKYDTKIEDYEMDLINAYFPNSCIFNPSSDLAIKGQTEKDIMKECLKRVRQSDIIVFSSVDGCVGKGVYQEVKEAHKNYKPVFYIYRDTLYTNAIVSKNDNSINDRIYGLVSFKDLEDLK